MVICILFQRRYIRSKKSASAVKDSPIITSGPLWPGSLLKIHSAIPLFKHRRILGPVFIHCPQEDGKKNQGNRQAGGSIDDMS